MHIDLVGRNLNQHWESEAGVRANVEYFKLCHLPWITLDTSHGASKACLP